MNAAFLLVTSAWFAGQTPVQAPAVQAAPVPAASAAVASGPIIASGGGSCSNCGGGQNYAPASCDACCDSGWGHRIKGRFSGLFNRGGNCGCETQTCNSCDSGCGHGHTQRNWISSQPSCNSCATTTSCNTCNTCDTGCGHGSGGGFFSRFRGMFNRGGSDCGCTGGCNDCNSCGSTPYVGGAYGSTGSMGTINPTPAPAGGEIINTPPKKMPANPAPMNPNPAKQGRIDQPAAPIAPAAPSVEVAPPAVPNIDTDRREPF